MVFTVASCILAAQRDETMAILSVVFYTVSRVFGTGLWSGCNTLNLFDMTGAKICIIKPKFNIIYTLYVFHNLNPMFMAAFPPAFFGFMTGITTIVTAPFQFLNIPIYNFIKKNPGSDKKFVFL